jgi:hypothetical protein
MMMETALCPKHGEPMVDSRDSEPLSKWCPICDGERQIARDQVDAIDNLSEAVERAATLTAEATDAVARSLVKLGNADADTPMGALEALGKTHKEGMELIAGALGNENCGGVSTALDEVTTAIEKHATAVNGLAEAIRDGLALLATAIGNLGGRS